MALGLVVGVWSALGLGAWRSWLARDDETVMNGVLDRRSLAAKVGERWAGAVAPARDAHLSDDETVAKMGHPAWRSWMIAKDG